MKRARTDGLRADVWTLPNLISLGRILLTPVFLAAVLGRRPKLALLVFLAAAATDFLDGLAARALKVRSKLGMILDPAGDKILMTAAYVVLTIKPLAAPNALPLALTLIVLGRDLMIAGGALYGYLRWRETTFPPSLLGKACTIFQMGTVVLVLAGNFLGRPAPWLTWLHVSTAALTAASGADYVLYGFRRVRRLRSLDS
jgi:cardiolipin synthase